MENKAYHRDAIRLSFVLLIKKKIVKNIIFIVFFKRFTLITFTIIFNER